MQSIINEAQFQDAAAMTYLSHGVERILTSPDHLLFLLAVLLLAKGQLHVAAVVAAFGVAHSLTLTAAALGFVHVPRKPVAVAMALSTILVAVRIVLRKESRLNAANHLPWMSVFVFGWLHGFSLADALRQVGLSQHSSPVAVLSFNAGVELGQILFVCGALVTVAASRLIAGRVGALQSRWSWRVSPYAIGAVAAFLFIQRLVAA